MNFGTSNGAIYTAQKVVIYGTEGIGKTLLANKFPDPIFIDIEESSKGYNVRRITRPDGGVRPTSWTMLLEMVKAIRDRHISAKTLVVDTLDWAETLCINHICDKYKKTGIEDFGYGKGYTYVEEEFGRLLNLLSEVVAVGIHVVCTSHAALRRIELPEETGSYDHWELKLEKRDSALVKEWADMVLFCNYKTIVIAGNNPMEKNKAAGGKRVMHATHTPWWDAKNRYDLPDDMPMEYESIGHIFELIDNSRNSAVLSAASDRASTVTERKPTKKSDEIQFNNIPDDNKDIPPQFPEEKPEPNPSEPPAGIPKQLWDLMTADGISEEQLQTAVAKKGYYPVGTPISNYDPQFINGCLIACWDAVKSMIN